MWGGLKSKIIIKMHLSLIIVSMNLFSDTVGSMILRGNRTKSLRTSPWKGYFYEVDPLKDS